MKLDEAAAGMASKLNSAKEFLAEKQHSVTDSAPVKAVKEKVGHFVPQGAAQYFSEYSNFGESRQCRPAP